MGAEQPDALRQIQAWIEHWQADVAAGLKPTSESLEAARALLQQIIVCDDLKCRCVGTFGPNPDCGACGGSGCVGDFGDLGNPQAAQRNRSAMMRLFASPPAPTQRGDR